MNRSVLNFGADQRLASGSESNWNGQLWSEENLDLNNFRFGKKFLHSFCTFYV
jgi:hypothetical protein